MFKLTEEIEGVLDYCSADEEYKDFREWLLQEGDITDEERDQLLSSDDALQSIVMKKYAKSSGHIWGSALIARKHLKDLYELVQAVNPGLNINDLLQRS